MDSGFILGFNEVRSFLTYGVLGFSFFRHFVFIVEGHPDVSALLLRLHFNV